MKILMVTPYLPYPPSSGGQVRSYNLLKNLGKKHQITLVSLIKSDEEKKLAVNLKEYCEEIHVCKRSESPWTANNLFKSIFGPHPFLIVRNFSQEAKNVVFNLVKKRNFDLIHAETFYIMPHIPHTSIPILLVEQTIEYQVYQHFVKSLKYFFLRIFFYLDVLKLKFWEKRYWQKADLVIAVSDTDKKKMLEIAPHLTIKIIPNGAGEDLITIFDEKKKQRPIFLYQGNFSWLQNVEAAQFLAKDIFPKIKKQIPEAICYIAGQLARKKIGHLGSYSVEIVDIDPSNIDMVKQMYAQSSIFLAPIKGPGGTRLKVLGAMAAGLPVISSNVGIEGLEVKDGEDILAANTDEEFLKMAIHLLKDAKLYRKIQLNARHLIEKKYNWITIAHNLEKTYLHMQKKYHENSN